MRVESKSVTPEAALPWLAVSVVLVWTIEDEVSSEFTGRLGEKTKLLCFRSQHRHFQIIVHFCLNQAVVINTVAQYSKSDCARCRSESDIERLFADRDGEMGLSSSHHKRPETYRAKDLSISLLIEPLGENGANAWSTPRRFPVRGQKPSWRDS